jgi:hypothetical protein
MKSVCLAQPDAEKWKCIAADFYSAANYPNCVGTMDGKHVRVTQPTHTGSMYYNCCFVGHVLFELSVYIC